jgi:hypothetical protein
MCYCVVCRKIHHEAINACLVRTSLPWVIDGSLEGGEGDMLREVERFLGATFFCWLGSGGFILPRVRYFLVGKHNRLFVGGMGFPWGRK